MQLQGDVLNVLAAIGTLVGGIIIGLWRWKKQIDDSQRRVESKIELALQDALDQAVQKTLTTFMALNADLRRSIEFYQADNTQLRQITERLTSELVHSSRDRAEQSARIQQLEREIIDLKAEISRLTAELKKQNEQRAA